MAAKTTIPLGPRSVAETLFTYPNDGHEDQTLEQTITHYITDSLEREEVGLFSVNVRSEADSIFIDINVKNGDVANAIGARYRSFFSVGSLGSLGSKAAEEFQARGDWDHSWKFLLPLGWHNDLRAVAIEVLKRRLRMYDVKQITIFADACRSLPADINATDLTADGVLGRGPSNPQTMPYVDKFIAAQDGTAAFMVPGENPEDDRCLFSGVLLEGLWGTKPTAFSAVRKHLVTSNSLGTYLKSEVAKVAGRYRYTLNPIVTPIGDLESIRRMAYYYIYYGQPIPYDIALLAQLRGDLRDGLLWAHVPAVSQREARTEFEKRFEWAWNETPAEEGWVGGLWPWTRQGWAFLDNPAAGGSTLTLPGLIELTGHLKSGRLTTLDAQGGRELARLFKLGQSTP